MVAFDFFRQQWCYPYSGRTWDDLTRWANAAMFNISIEYLWPLLRIPSNRFAIDLGCGNGWAAYLLSSFRQVLAIDTSEPALKTICPAFGKGIHRVLADGMDLPLLNESVDIIFMNSTYHHMPDRGVALTEWHRVLKLGGRLVATGEMWSSQADIERRRENYRAIGVTDEDGFTKEELMSLLDASSFTAIEYLPIKYMEGMQHMGREQLVTDVGFNNGLILATK